MKFPATLVRAALLLVLFSACDQRNNSRGTQNPEQSLQQARQGFETRLARHSVEGIPVAQPPPNLFRLMKYKSTVGELPAYVSIPNQAPQKHPAIIWLV